MDLSQLLSPRTMDDVFAQRVRLTIGGEEVFLPALVISETEDWLRSFDATMETVLDAVTAAGEDAGAAISALASDIEPFLELLVSYDKSGVLPSRAKLRDLLTPMDLLVACLEVWRAANPLLDVGLGTIVGTRLALGVSPKPTSSRRRRGAGPQSGSGLN